MIRLDGLTPAAEEGWWTLFDLAQVDTECWMVIGGQMMHLLAAEHGVSSSTHDAAAPSATNERLVVAKHRLP